MMLSRLNPITGSRSLVKCIRQFQVPATSIGTSSVHSQKDLGNVPRPQRYENTPETRLGFLPKSWFDFMYPKTGVTGPYMLLTGMGVYMFSKEIIVVSPEFTLLAAALVLVGYVHGTYGTKIKALLEKKQLEEIENVNSSQVNRKAALAEEIEENKELKWQAEGIAAHLPDAKRENVYLQMEAAYRARMQDAFTKVKKHLDYQVEKQNIERRIAQRNMVDYVIRNVQASISPQLKSSTLKQCISDLKSLSAKA